MPLLYAIIGIAGWQAALIALYHFGEVDTFWFIVLELVSALAFIGALGFGWAASVDWSK